MQWLEYQSRRVWLRKSSGATYLDKGGRVIAKTKPMSLGAEPSQYKEERIWAEMVKNHAFTRNLTVQGGVIPALGVMQREHCYKEQNLVDLAKASALVPPERALMVGKGLYWGMVGDFGMAVHFLIPQLENIVRFHMKGAELKTSNTDLDGIENENGLSTLLDVEGVDAVLGADIVFEMKALFCSAFGPNLRNAFLFLVVKGLDEYRPTLGVHLAFPRHVGLVFVAVNVWSCIALAVGTEVFDVNPKLWQEEVRAISRTIA